MDTLWAHYAGGAFARGMDKGENKKLSKGLGNWKRYANRLEGDLTDLARHTSILHKGWYNTTLNAVTWQRLAEELYRRHYNTTNIKQLENIQVRIREEVVAPLTPYHPELKKKHFDVPATPESNARELATYLR